MIVFVRDERAAKVIGLAKAMVDPGTLAQTEGIPGTAHTYQVAFLSTFFTSVWLWLYVLAAFRIHVMKSGPPFVFFEIFPGLIEPNQQWVGF